MFKPLAVAATFVLAALSAMPVAAAEIFRISYEGEVFDSFDVNAPFGGNPGEGYDGSTFTALFEFTVPTPGAIINTDGATYVETLGGSSLFTPTPGFGRLEIDNAPLIAGDVFALFLRQVVPGGPDQILTEATTDLGNGGSAGFKLNVGSPDNSLFPSLGWTGTRLLDPTDPGTSAYGSFNLVTYDSFGNVSYAAGGSLAIYSITVSRETVGAVPEPASWALLILGFGAIGGALRRRGTARAFA